MRMPNMPRMRSSPSSSQLSIPGIHMRSPKLPIFAHTSSADRSIVISARASPIGAAPPCRAGVWSWCGCENSGYGRPARSSSRNEVPVPSPAELFDLTGKVAVVTGGSRGIGRAVSFALAAAGAEVVVASRKLENCESTAAEITEATGHRAVPMAVNVSHWEQCDQLVENVYTQFGHCEVLINNAGLSPLYPDLVSVTEELYDKAHAVNAKGPFRLATLIGTRMFDGDGGSIINVSTAGSWRPDEHDLPYAMAKAGLNALTLGLAGGVNPKVRANTVLPGPFETDITKAWGEGTIDMVNQSNPMRRIGQPDDMAGVCVFLASDASSYVNGAQILCDGGAFRTL